MTSSTTYFRPARTANVRADRHAAGLKRLKLMASVMDQAITVPGTRLRLGVDSVLGLVPVAGDVLSAGISLYAVAEAYRMGVPRRLLARMMANIAFDAGIGAVPVLGDVLDIFFRSNSRNVKLLIDHIEKNRR